MKHKKQKKPLLIVAAVVLTAAVGAGIWFASKSSGEPVNVYSFQYIGMTEFWGDTQESYGPVATDKIQTVFLSDTQTVTEVKVKDGDSVKKGDVLFTFDTSLDALTLERKRLDVEKIKVQIKAAEERLQDTRELVPYEPPGESTPEETQPDPGDAIKGAYEISGDKDNTTYDGKTQETALICWLKDTTPITDAILQELYQTSLDYRKVNENKQPDTEGETPETEEKTEQEGSNASALPEAAKENADSENEEKYQIEGEFTCNDEQVRPDNMMVGKAGYLIKDSYTHDGKTYWLKSATRGKGHEPLKDLKIPPYPQTREEQLAWEALWADGVKVEYVRHVSITAKQRTENGFEKMEEDTVVELEVGEDATFLFHSWLKHAPRDTKLTFAVKPSDGLLKADFDEETGTLTLTGKPEKAAAAPVEYQVTAKHTFEDNHGQQRAVEETFSFTVSVVEPPRVSENDFYVVFKVTEGNYKQATPLTWEGVKVSVYEDGTFGMQMYDASAFADHTLPVPEDEITIDLPEIDPDAMYTAEQILDMQKQLYATIKEQTEKLKTAEFEYDIMQRELGDGNIYAEIDGKVVALLTEEEARANQQPVVKVSGGGGFYIEGSVSELEKEKLKLGQEVTVNDWNTGSTYTGEVVSIGDFPSDRDNWNGMGNPNASYYPFKAFVGEDADLQAGSYVSMNYSTASAEQGIYLEKPFVRTEKGKSYIFVRGADGRLEKREVSVGRVLWGSYYEILSPLGEEDYLAFPYGKQVRDGAPTVESDLNTLYGF